MKLQALRWQSLPWFKASRPQWRYALRNGIAMCLALSIAYALDLDEPYWAMTSAAVVSFPTVGGVSVRVLAVSPAACSAPAPPCYWRAIPLRPVAILIQYLSLDCALYLGLRDVYQ